MTSSMMLKRLFVAVAVASFVVGIKGATVSSVSPTTGSFVGATITVTGTGFADGCIIQLGSSGTYASATLTACNGNNYNSATSIECVTPTLSSSASYIFVSCAGVAQTTSTTTFTPAAPTTSSIATPNSASVSTFAGSTLTITGTNFGCGCTVALSTSSSSATTGALTCTSPTATAATTMTCLTPALAYPQTYYAWVTCGSSTSATGQSFATATTVVTSSTASTGSLIGAPVTITGNYFSTGCTVNFDISSSAVTGTAAGTIAATNVVVSNCVANKCTTITCNTGTMLSATPYYAWVTCNGLSAVTNVNAIFTPGIPTVVATGSGTVSQNGATSGSAYVNLPNAVAQTVRVYGTNIGVGCSVSLSTSITLYTTGAVACTSSTWASVTSIDCLVPATLTPNVAYYPWITCGSTVSAANTAGYIRTLSSMAPAGVGITISPTTGSAAGAVLTYTGIYLGTNCVASLSTSLSDITAGAVTCTATSITSTTIVCVTGTAVVGTPYYPWITCGTETGVGQTTTFTPAVATITLVSAATPAALTSPTITLTGTNIGQGCTVVVSTSQSSAATGAKTCFNPQSTSTTTMTCILDPTMTAATAYYPYVTCGASTMATSTVSITPTALAASSPAVTTLDAAASVPAGTGTIFAVIGTGLGTNCVVTVAASTTTLTSAGSIACQNIAAIATLVTCVTSTTLTVGTQYRAYVTCAGSGVSGTTTGLTIAIPTVATTSVNAVATSTTQAASYKSAASVVITGTNFGALAVASSALTTGCTVAVTASATDASSGAVACTNPQPVLGSLTTFSCSLPTTIAAAADYYAWVTCGSAVNGGTNPAKITVTAVNQLTAMTISGTPLNTLPGSTLTFGSMHTLHSGCTFKFATSATSSTGAASCMNPVMVSGTPSTTMTCQTPQLAAGTYYTYAVCGTNNYPASTNTIVVGAASGTAFTSVSPTVLSAAGGQTVTVTGTGLAAGFTVSVCGITQPTLSAGNTFVATALPTGNCGVVIQSSSVNIAGAASVTVVGPTVTNVVPSSLPLLTTTGQVLTITGTNLVSACTVLVGTTTCTVGTLTGTTSMPCTTAAALTAGANSVVVTCGAYKSNSFSLTAITPIASSVMLTTTQLNLSTSPLAVSLAGSPISITGTGFTPSGCTATVGGVTCTSPTYVSATTMTCVTPTLAANLYPVVVTCNSFVSTGNTFVNTTNPAVTGVTPLTTALVGTTLTVTGTNFGHACTISLTPPGGSATACTSPTWTSATTMTCVTPTLSAATGIVVAVTCNSVASTGTTVFVTADVPTVTAASPSVIGLDSSLLTVTGTNFGAGCTVALTPSGGSATACSSVTLVSQTTMTCVTPTLTAASGIVVSVTCNSVKSTSTSVTVTAAIPTISAVSPSTISLGGTPVTITGTNFGSSCSIGLTPAVGVLTACTNITYVSATTMTCITPLFAVQSGIVVSVTCSSTTTSSTGVTLTAAAPTVSSVTTSTTGSSTVAACVNTALTVTGTAFGARCSIALSYTTGGVTTAYACTRVAYVSDTSMMCLTPSTTPFNDVISGVVVSVTCNNVASTATSVTLSTAAPTVTAIAVDSNTAATTATGSVSGSALTITGTNFGSSSCTVSFTVWCSTQTCTATASKSGIVPTTYTSTSLTIAAGTMPDMTVGTYLVKVVCGLQTSTSTSVLYSVTGPTLVSVSPSVVTATLAGTGTNLVTVTGTNFGDGCTVALGSLYTGIATTYVSSTTLTFVPLVTFVASATAQTVIVTCTNVPTTSTTVTQTISAPTVTSVSPSVISLAGGGYVSVTGTAFAPGCTVSLNSVACLYSGFVSASQLVCATPPSTTTTTLNLPVSVTCGSTSSTGTVQNTTSAAPTASAVVPAAINTAAYQLVNITGSNFGQAGASGCVASINNINCLYTTVASSTSIICTTPSTLTAVTAGTVGVTCNSQAANTSLAVAVGAPTITGISPTTMSPAGGDVIVSGTNFAAGCIVQFGSSSVVCVPTSYIYSGSTTISCTVPGISSLSAQIVTVQCGSVSTTGTSVTLTPTAPSVTSATPAMISVAASVVSISGTYFYNGCTASIGSTACATSTVASATSLTCITSTAMSPGSYSVTVTCNGNTSPVSSLTPITVKVAPTVTSVSPAMISTVGSQTVTVSGTGLSSSCTVTIGGNACTSPSSSVSTSISCSSPAFATVGSVAVIVSCGTVNSVDTVMANIVGPTISQVTSAALVTNAGGQLVTVTGTGYQAGCTITIGTTACTTPTVVLTSLASGVYSSMTCTSPALAGTNALVVSVSCGTVKTSEQTVTVTPSSGGVPIASSLSTTNPMSTYGGANITVLGSGFGTGCTVTVGTAGSCTNVIVSSPTQLQCTAPGTSIATTQNVTVTCGSAAPTTGIPVQYVAPTVIAASTVNVSTAGGFLTTINGTGFITGCSVTVNGQTCAGVVVSSPTQLYCTAPTLAAGNQPIIVFCGVASAANITLAYVAPTVRSLAPSVAQTAPGTVIMINGTNFAPGCTFTVGGNLCTASTFVSTTLMSCVTPALSVGSALVVAQCGGTTTGYTSVNSTGSSLSVVPTVSTVTSSSLVTANGGAALTITGTGFISSCTVVIGTTPATSTYNTATSLTVSAPALAAGPHAAVVTCNNVSSTGRAVAIVYPSDNTTSPMVTNVTTDTLSTVGGTIWVYGMNLATGCSATVGGATCSGVVVLSSTLLTCVAPAPASAGVAPVVVTCGSKTSANVNGTGAPAITYGAPTMISVSPSVITTAAGTLLTISGSNFDTGCTVTVGNADCAVSGLTSTSLNCSSPIMTIGTAAVAVKCGTLSTTGFSVTVQTYVKPAVTGVIAGSPMLTSGATTVPVTITGTGFTPGCIVSVGGASCTSPVVSSPTSLTCLYPAKASGAQAVTVTCGTLTSDATSIGSAIYVVSGTKPTVASISPSSLSTVGGRISISGTNFATGCTVTVGGFTCASPTVAAVDSISCIAPALAPATQAVVVTCGSTVSTDVISVTYALAMVTGVTAAPPSLTSRTAIVTVNGTFLATGCTVLVGNVACSSPVFSSSDVKCSLPAPIVAGQQEAVVMCGTTSAVSGVSPLSIPPAVKAVMAPSVVTSAGGMVMQVVGAGFPSSGCRAFVDNVACSANVYVSAEVYNCTTPSASVGPHVVTVTCGNVPSIDRTTAVYAPTNTAPQLTYLATPVQLFTNGSIPVMLNGTNFATGCTVTINGTACSLPNTMSPGSMVCTAPAVSAPGTATVLVTCSGVSNGVPITYGTPADVPFIYSVTGPVGTGGGNITITGTPAFSTGCIAKVANSTCSLALATDRTRVTCTAPANDVGAQSVTVTCGRATSNTNVTLQYILPTASAVAPSSISTAGNVPITITGNGFGPFCTVSIAGKACAVTQPISMTSIVCVAPPNNASSQPVAIACGSYVNSDLRLQYVAPVNPSTSPKPSTSGPVDPAANPNIKQMELTVNGISIAALNDAQELDVEQKIDQGLGALIPIATINADAPSRRRRALLQSSTVAVEVSFAQGTSQEQMQASMTGATDAINSNFRAVFSALLAAYPGITGISARDLSTYYIDDSNDKKKKLAIGLGVGLGVGIPLIAALVFFCIWKSKRSAAGVVAPRESGANA